MISKSFALSTFVLALFLPASAFASTTTTDFDSFTLGSVSGQSGWSNAVNASYDQAVVDTSLFGSPSGFGTQALRVSDAVASGSFGDWIFTSSLANEAGETAAINSGFSGGTRQNHFEAQFDFTSASAVYQPGMHLSVSPDRGDGARMSYVRLEDQADGIHVFFDDYSSHTFNETDLATVDRTSVHSVKFSMDFENGADNDVVSVYVDGVLKITGTSWEGYFVDNQPAIAPPTVDSLIIQVRDNTTPSNPADAGYGFLIDNVILTSSSVTPAALYVDTATGNDSNNGSQATPFKTIQAAVTAAAPGGTINVAAGTYTEQATLSKDVTLSGAGASSTFIQAPGVLVADSFGKKAILEIGSAASTTVTGFTVEGPGPSSCGSIDYGIFVVGGASANIHDNAVSNIADNPLGGCQNAIGIQVGRQANATTGTATITNNVISGYQKNGITIDNTGSSATITNNTVTGAGPTTAIAQNGVQISRGATGTITGNTITGNVYTGGAGACAGDGSVGDKDTFDSNCDESTGILLYQQGSGVVITGNTSNANQLAVAMFGGPAATFTNNNISGATVYGLDTDVALDATRNYWGSVNSPVADHFLTASTLAAYSPWFTDAAMTTLGYTVATSSATTTATTGSSTTTLTGTSTANTNITVTAEIPSGTTITGDTSWDGTIAPPTATVTSVTVAGSNTTVAAAITIGSSDSDLTFDQAVKLTFAGEVGLRVGWYDHAGNFTEITTTCDSLTTPTLGAGASCKIDSGSDLVVWTKHFSTFVVYTQVLVPNQGGASGGSSSGGGGGSVSVPVTATPVTTPVTTTTTTTTTVPPVVGKVLGAAAYNFTKDLSFGAHGTDVTELQKILIAEGYLKIPAPTAYFGALTKAAVVGYQKAHKVSPTSGYVGPRTRPELNKGAVPTVAESVTATSTATH